MSAEAVRARQLMAMGRWADAADAWRRVLAGEPGDGFAHGQLALCLVRTGDAPAARREALAAVQAAPDEPMAHWIRAVVALHDDRLPEAESAALEALRLDPDDPDHYHILAAALNRLDRAQDALARCEAGLAIDPEHAALTDLRASILTRLGRRDEAEASIREALRRDPDDAEQHANMGWARLSAGDPESAARHFSEALRLEPDNAYAREGLVEAMKSRHAIYRLFLAWTLWMARLSPPTRWAVVIVGFLLYRLCSRLAELHPEMAPWLMPLVWAYFAFAFLTWMAKPLFNLLLLAHPLGRHALAQRERQASLGAGACMLVAVLAVAAYPLTGHAVALLAALAAAFATAVVYDAWEERIERHRRWLIPLTTLYLAAITTSVVLVGCEVLFGARLWNWCMYAWIALLLVPPLLRSRGI